MAIMDDNYFVGPPTVIFQANEVVKADLAKVGLQL